MITLILFIALNFLLYRLFMMFNKSRSFILLRVLIYFLLIILLEDYWILVFDYISISISKKQLADIQVSFLISILFREILLFWGITYFKQLRKTNKDKREIPYDDISFGVFLIVSCIIAFILF
ncbi:MAG: hypothetical protein ACI8ZX_002241 [Planctomycetota bacterium]|jgi:hypothetical protein